ncbi:MAG: Spy/CpxP family protein refolding chaperone [Rhodocyclales bacterium]|nr:Spy/CpxP family protein refolding chaperone [Rhodocyclales bacterium]
MTFRNLLAGCALTLAAVPTFAAPPADMPPGQMPPPPMMGPGREPMPPFLHDVVLTEEQRDKLFEIMHAQMPAMRAREKELRQSHEALHKLSQNSEFDDVKARALADAGARALAEIALTRARVDHKIYRLLTPEQRKQIDAPRPRDAEHCGEPPRR